MRGRIQDYLRSHNINPGVALGYAALVVLFVWTLAQFYIPGKGLSYLIAFGAKQENARLSKVRKLDYFVARASDGYDAQYYVQVAMDPSLQNRELRQAVDSLPYRARRILFSATAYVLGFGRPGWILQAFALQNVLCWFLLAGLLLHWFPPRSWDNFLRWTGIVFSFGVCVSCRNALFDGPSLLLIAWGVYLLEKGRPWGATAVLALSGLGKETNLLGSAALLPKTADGGRAWGLAMARGLLTALPLALWILYIALAVGGKMDDLGARNFDLPFVAYLRKWQEIGDGWADVSVVNAGPLWSLLMLVALTVQFLFLMLRPQWDKAWWRIGLSFALLMIFLGDAVWEGYPGAASRVLLPMQLAFNILVPAGRAWWLVLVLGNLTLLAAPATLESPTGEGYVIKGRDELVYGRAGQKVTIDFSDTWYPVERHNNDYWCWSAGEAVLTLHNPHPAPLRVRLRFSLNVNERRRVRLSINGADAWATELGSSGAVNVVLGEVVLQPGDSAMEFSTDTPPSRIGTDPRPLAFRVQNLRIDLQQLLPVTPAK
ncbi:MAG TPA: hypothetical protein VKC51_12510 [Lacunisphaera sp.]|nr:hypothetical protein [Lacunisphaera sp.]